MRSKFKITKAFQYAGSTFFMCFERSAAGTLKDAAVRLNIRHTEPGTGAGNLCFCATALMVPVTPPQTSCVRTNRKAYFPGHPEHEEGHASSGTMQTKEVAQMSKHEAIIGLQCNFTGKMANGLSLAWCSAPEPVSFLSCCQAQSFCLILPKTLCLSLSTPSCFSRPIDLFPLLAGMSALVWPQ